MNRSVTRLLSSLMTAALVVGLAPSMAFAAPTDRGATALSKTAVAVEELDNVPTADELRSAAYVGIDGFDTMLDSDGRQLIVQKPLTIADDGIAPAAAYPARFDLRNVDLNGDGVPENYVTSVKNQGALGTCWAHAAMAAAETSILSETREAVTSFENELDLSEHHVAWFSHSPLPRENAPANQGGEGLYNDITPANSSKIFTRGAWAAFATAMFGSFIGPLPEKDAPYTNTEGTYDPTIEADSDNAAPSPEGDWSLPEELRFSPTDDYELEESFVLPSLTAPEIEGPAGAPAADSSDVEADGEGEGGVDAGGGASPEEVAPTYNERALNAIKDQLMAGRPVQVSYDSSSWYLNTLTFAHYVYETIDGPTLTNNYHAVCIVGWDDDYPASNYLDGHQPPADGAFIVKNSWGAKDSKPGQRGNWGVDGSGYFYISYYDRSVNGFEALDFVTDADADRNGGPEESTSLYHYQYNYMPVTTQDSGMVEGLVSMANVFEFEEPAVVQTVATTALAAGTHVRFDLYLLDEGESEPTSGVLATSKDADFPYGGFHRVELDEPVFVDAGQKLGVVLSSIDEYGNGHLFTPTQTSKFYQELFAPDEETPLYWGEAVINAGESFFGVPSTRTTFDDGSYAYSDYTWTDRAASRAAEVQESERAYAAIADQLEAAKRERQAAYREWQHPTSYDEDALAKAEQRHAQALQTLNELAYSVPSAALIEADNYPITVYATDCDPNNPPTTETVEMARLYNPHTGEHFYTADQRESTVLNGLGWQTEGVGWVAPVRSNTAVSRLYNPYSGEHLYTTAAHERDVLVGLGWNDEGTGFYSANDRATPVYRVANSNDSGAGAHMYTTLVIERDRCLAAGWRDEGVVWYGMGSSL